MKAGENRTTEKMDVLPSSSTATDSNNFSKKSFGKDVGKLVSGTLVAQIIGLCLTPIITRIFSAEIYGVAAVFTSIVSIIVVIACLRYEMAIMLPKNENEAGSLLCLCFICLFIISFLSFIIMLFLGGWIAELLGNPAVKEWLFLIPLAVFIDGLYLAIRYWNTRKKRFGTQAITQIVQSLSGSGLKLAFGFGGFINAGALIITGIIGNLLGTLILFFQALRSDFTLIKNSFSLPRIWKVAKRYKKFPLYNVWGAMLNTLSWQIPVLIITAFFSPEIAGLYALGMTVIHIPMNLVGNSISQVYLQRASVAVQNNTLPSLTRDTTATLLMLSLLPFSLLSIISGDLFSVFFGAEWYEAGIFTQILAFWAMIWFITSALGPTAVVLEKQEANLIYNIILVITRILSLIIGGILGNIYLGLFLFAISGLLVYGGIGVLYVFIWSRVSPRTLGKTICKPIIISILLALFVLLLSLTQINSIVLCGIAVATCIIYIIYLFKKEPLIKSYLGREAKT